MSALRDVSAGRLGGENTSMFPVELEARVGIRTQHLPVGRVSVNAVHDWEGEFALRKVFSESFVMGVLMHS